jgi:hypothetical protein
MGQSGREMASPSCGQTWPRNASQPLLTQSAKSSRATFLNREEGQQGRWRVGPEISPI